MLSKDKEVVPSSEDEEESSPVPGVQSATHDRESSPDVPMSSAQHEEDPIEPSEEPESPGADDDPIEVGMSQVTLDKSTPPPTPLPKNRTVKKMKDRNGNARDTQATSTTAEHNTATARPKADANQPIAAASADAEPLSSASAITTTAKKRGRPPLSAEVKAERARIAAEKKALQNAKKQAEKAAQQAEKARLKSTTTKSVKGTKGVAGDAPVSGQTTVKATPTVVPETAAAVATPASQDPTPTTNGWETLSATPSAHDMTQIDELRSSSPGHTEREDNGDKSAGPVPPASSDDEDRQDQLTSTPLVKTAGATSATPLFLPSSQAPHRVPPHSQLNGSPFTQRESASQVSGLIKSAMRPVSSWKLPRLSDIASQGMFTPLTAHPVPPRPSTDVKKRSLGNALGDDDSSSDSSDSDDEEVLSHIPKERRAGAAKK